MFRICMYVFLTWLFFSMNGVIEIFEGMGKILKFAGMLFIYLKVINKQGVPEPSIIHLRI